MSRTNQVKEAVLAAEQVGVETVEAVHRSAETFSFIRPETSLPARGDD